MAIEFNLSNNYLASLAGASFYTGKNFILRKYHDLVFLVSRIFEQIKALLFGNAARNEQGEAHLAASGIVGARGERIFSQGLDDTDPALVGPLPKAMPSFSSLFEAIPRVHQEFDRRWEFSNETKQEETIRALRRDPAYGDTFIGTGCFFSLNAFAIRPARVDHLVIIDINSKVEDFWASIQRVLLNATNCEQAIIEAEKFLSPSSLPQLRSEASPFSTREKFTKVKKMFQEGKFAFLSADFVNAPTLRSIGTVLKESSRSIDTIYVSNIGDCQRAVTRGWFHYNNFVKQSLISTSQKQGNYLSVYAIGGYGGAEHSSQFCDRNSLT